VNLTISQPIKILALVGVLAIVAFGASTMMLGRAKTPTPPKERVGAAAPQRHSGVTPPKTQAAVTPTKAHTKPAAAATAAAKAHRASVAHHNAVVAQHKALVAHRMAVARHKAAVKHAARTQRGNLVYADLPPPLQWQLSQHKVVVVSIYNPNANVDAIAVAEAHQGAADAGAGFLLVSVLDNKVAGILTGLLPGGGLLPAPGILVYRAPGNIALRIDGFADRVSVAQAAQNAMSGQVTATPPASAAPAVSAAGAAVPASPTLTP
jgi:hypothetical protein